MMSEVGFIPRETIHKIKMELVGEVVNHKKDKKYSQYVEIDHFDILVLTYYFSFLSFRKCSSSGLTAHCLIYHNGGGRNR